MIPSERAFLTNSNERTRERNSLFMRKIVCLLLAAAVMLTCAAAMAEKTVIDPSAARDVSIQKAGENTTAEGVSPTTGRNLEEVAAALPEQYKATFNGLALTGTYLPLMVQVTNTGSGINARAPWYGSYADVVYEGSKTRNGVTRFTMVFSDILPEWVGCCRSIRVQHVWLREEWNAPFVYHGHQSNDGNVKGTDVSSAIRELGWHVPELPDSPGIGVFYDGIDMKEWSPAHFHCKRISYDNIIFNVPKLIQTTISKQDIVPKNHAYLFTDAAPEGGDTANRVYVYWNKYENKTGDENSTYYFNNLLEYEPDEGVYYRYILKDKDNTNNAVLFEEMAPTNIKSAGSDEITCDLTHGEPITFSNVIVQYVDMQWYGNDEPKPTVTGTGNADFFMGGKHYSGVWNRDTLDERTVFYGEDGQEMALLPGRTLIMLMDWTWTDFMGQPDPDCPREVAYE